MINTFVWHKLIATSSILIISGLGFLLFPFDQLARWNLLLLTIIIFGYSHFIIGGIYQVRSFSRKERPLGWHIWFSALTIISILIAALFIRAELADILAFIVISYFILHGYFNEITLFERQTKRPADRLVIASIALILSAIIFNAVGHSSWFFSSNLTFIQLNSGAIFEYLTTNYIAVVARLGAIVLAISAILILAYATWKQGFKLMYLGLLGATVVLAGLTFVWHPFHYLFLWGALLLYHFVVWFIFFLDQFITFNRTELYRYIGLHIIILVPFIVHWLGLPGAIWVESYVLNIHTFITFALIHISVSFLSEPWFARWCRLA